MIMFRILMRNNGSLVKKGCLVWNFIWDSGDLFGELVR